ncbi:hypothetical protein HT031_005744 [Scenedesmus sp. PABB004]|nr:hypothetical protein HT031_005744 [Scenedesmus sp. PABB004]
MLRRAGASITWLVMALALGLLLLPSSARACEVRAVSAAANLDGAELLVLDAGSLRYRGPHAGAAFTDADACADACGALPGCNAWTWCGRPGGCGSGCGAWTAKHAKLATQGIAAPDPVDANLPVLGFGAWTSSGPGGAASTGCAVDAARGAVTDAWPYGLCSLKRVPDPASPAIFGARATAAAPASSAAAAAAAAAGDGWVSGALVASPDCAGLPANVCRACGASRDAAACLKCARDARAQWRKPIRYLLADGPSGRGNRVQNTCATCADMPAPGLRDRCFDCVLSNSSCATCVFGRRMWGPGPPDAAACFNCTTARGAAFAGACNACAQSAAPARCFACLATFPLAARLCKPGAAGGAACIGPNDQTPCDLCANAAPGDGAAFSACADCSAAVSPERSDECTSCASTPGTAAGQERCFRCVRAAKGSAAGSRCAGAGQRRLLHAVALRSR